MTALTDWLDSLESFAPAANQRTTRRLGGSAGTLPDRPRLIVIHTIESPEDNGRARSTAGWIKASGGSAQVSCHFCVDNTEAIRCVADEHTAFTQLTPWNDMSLSIEQAGRAASTTDEWNDPYSLAQRALTAKIVAAWCQRWAIPNVWLTADDLVSWRTCTGITSHAEISQASKRPELVGLGYKPGDHWDPGPNYPIDDLMARVAAYLSPLPPPVLPPADLPLGDDMALYVTNSEPRKVEGKPGPSNGAWPPDYLVYAIEYGRIRTVLPAEWEAAKDNGVRASRRPNNELDYQFDANGTPRQ